MGVIVPGVGVPPKHRWLCGRGGSIIGVMKPTGRGDPTTDSYCSWTMRCFRYVLVPLNLPTPQHWFDDVISARVFVCVCVRLFCVFIDKESTYQSFSVVIIAGTKAFCLNEVLTI